MWQRRWALIAVLIGFGATACGGAGAANRTADGTLTVKSPAADAKVAWPAKVALVAKGVTIEPVGDAQVRDGSGHYHVMVDTDCVKKGEVIPKDADHIHFGKGATTLSLGALAPGRHELCIQVGDGLHAALDATTSVTITVGAITEKAWQAEANALCKPQTAAVDKLVAKFSAAHPGLIDGAVGGGTAEERAAALDDFWDFAEEIGTMSQPIHQAVVALAHPDTTKGNAAHEDLVAAMRDADAFARQLLRDRPRDIFDRLDDLDRTGPLANLNQTWEDLGLFDCI
jgi:hypothetical protein